MKKCPVCKSNMELKTKTIEINTQGTLAASASAYVLLSSSSPQAPFGTPIAREYWLCLNEKCGTIVE